MLFNDVGPRLGLRSAFLRYRKSEIRIQWTKMMIFNLPVLLVPSVSSMLVAVVTGESGEPWNSPQVPTADGGASANTGS